ncbi:hypothetical protein [Amycolatopsis sp. NPDC051903]|uniref:hypothetical protein n=1 Tax=Amycolatopsis sp. NPDC051903 TaxID=3363936 RepID=UPI0037B9AB88
MSSLQLASSDEGRIPAVVIRKAARVADLVEAAPSMAEQRAQRRQLRCLAPQKRAGLRGAA